MNDPANALVEHTARIQQDCRSRIPFCKWRGGAQALAICPFSGIVVSICTCNIDCKGFKHCPCKVSEAGRPSHRVYSEDRSATLRNNQVSDILVRWRAYGYSHGQSVSRPIDDDGRNISSHLLIMAPSISGPDMASSFHGNDRNVRHLLQDNLRGISSALLWKM